MNRTRTNSFSWQNNLFKLLYFLLYQLQKELNCYTASPICAFTNSDVHSHHGECYIIVCKYLSLWNYEFFCLMGHRGHYIMSCIHESTIQIWNFQSCEDSLCHLLCMMTDREFMMENICLAPPLM